MKEKKKDYNMYSVQYMHVTCKSYSWFFFLPVDQAYRTGFSCKTGGRPLGSRQYWH